ncbi:hypothetical protein I4U23_003815 [Adineta vaga]|nr:hypothetical protein I4U23_003815 [Adineta vaga]
MTGTMFDKLPNELVFKILGYLTAIDAWHAFYDISTRLNDSLQVHKTNLDLSCCRKSQFDYICQCILKKVHSPFDIKFSSQIMEDSTKKLFSQLKSKDINHLLQSLTLTHLTKGSMDIVDGCLNRFTNLRSLTVMHEREKSFGKFVVKVMSIKMPSLTYLKLGYNRPSSSLGFDESNLDKLHSGVPNIQEFVLQIPITFNIFYRFLSVLSQITSMDVILMGRTEHEYIDNLNSFDYGSNLRKLVITMTGIVPFKNMARFLRNLSQLHTFWFSAFICDYTCGAQYQDGQVWEDLIHKYLPHLTDFRLNVGLEAAQSSSISDVIQPYCNSFWTEDKKWWFVADRPDNDVDTIELYSLPPPIQGKIIFRPNVPWISNSRHPSFKSIKTLGLLPSSKQSDNLKAEYRQYTNVTTIRPQSSQSPDYKHDLSIIFQYIDLTKVETFILNSSQLFAALPAMTNLVSLSIRCYDGDIDRFKAILSPILTLKKLILSETMHCYFYNQNDVKLITQLFPNLEYLEMRINELECLPILINDLCHLIYAVIINEPELIDLKQLKKWLHKNETGIQYTWAVEDTRLDIWLE